MIKKIWASMQTWVLLQWILFFACVVLFIMMVSSGYNLTIAINAKHDEIGIAAWKAAGFEGGLGLFAIAIAILRKRKRGGIVLWVCMILLAIVSLLANIDYEAMAILNADYAWGPFWGLDLAQKIRISYKSAIMPILTIGISEAIAVFYSTFVSDRAEAKRQNTIATGGKKRAEVKETRQPEPPKQRQRRAKPAPVTLPPAETGNEAQSLLFGVEKG